MEKTSGIGNIVRIAIVGPESTGKTTLAMQLATHYKTAFVPEYAREYVDKLNRPYTIEDILAISKKQIETEDEIAAKANKLLICDTNLIVTKIWAEHAYSQCPEWIAETMQKRHYHLHLLCNTDIPWEPDPQREHPHLREYLFEKYKEELERQNVTYAIISGLYDARTETAIKAIEELVNKI